MPPTLVLLASEMARKLDPNTGSNLLIESSPTPQPAADAAEQASWANRGWYLAIEYGVLARDRFLNRLPKLRALGRFKELLEPGGKILYRNLFRESEVKDAWELLTALRPWHEHLVCYLNGEETPLKEVHDVLWCAAFLIEDNPCRGPDKKKERWVGCPGARLRLGPGAWDLSEDDARHALTFTSVDEAGTLQFDGPGLAAFVAGGRRAQLCPRSPARHPQGFAAAFRSTPVRSLGWPLVAEMSPELQKQIGAKALEQEHSFVLKKGQEDLEAHAALELRARGETLEVRRAGTKGKSIASEVRVSASIRRALDEGVALRGMRMEEAYSRRKGGHYVLEQRFVVSTRVHLLASDRPDQFQGYVLTTFPRATPEYTAWVQGVLEALP